MIFGRIQRKTKESTPRLGRWDDGPTRGCSVSQRREENSDVSVLRPYLCTNRGSCAQCSIPIEVGMHRPKFLRQMLNSYRVEVSTLPGPCVGILLSPGGV